MPQKKGHRVAADVKADILRRMKEGGISVAQSAQEHGLHETTIFLANVGVNCAHGLYSPLFDDGTFEFVPIPEGGHRKEVRATALPPLPTYADLRCYREGAPLLELFPPKLQEKYADALVHYDPNFSNPYEGDLAAFTYGDIPFASARGSSLRHTKPGDIIFFLARLTPIRDGKVYRPDGAFHLIGCLHIQAIFEHRPGGAWLIDCGTGNVVPMASHHQNAHVRQWDSLPQRYQDEHFLVFQGSARSRRFTRAVPIDARMVKECFRTAQGRPFETLRFRTFQACLGCYTRTVRPIYQLGIAAERKRYLRLLERLGAAASSIFPD